MGYPKFFKELVLSIPVLRRIVNERDRLRDELLELSEVRKQRESEIHEKINAGYCHSCRQTTNFQIKGDWLRDNYVCLNCYSIPRQRHIQYVLDSFFTGWEGLVVHESSPSNDLISRFCSSYSLSQYFNGISGGGLLMVYGAKIWNVYHSRTLHLTFSLLKMFLNIYLILKLQLEKS
jgi:hypothetical protein